MVHQQQRHRTSRLVLLRLWWCGALLLSSLWLLPMVMAMELDDNDNNNDEDDDDDILDLNDNDDPVVAVGAAKGDGDIGHHNNTNTVTTTTTAADADADVGRLDPIIVDCTETLAAAVDTIATAAVDDDTTIATTQTGPTLISNNIMWEETDEQQARTEKDVDDNAKKTDDGNVSSTTTSSNAATGTTATTSAETTTTIPIRPELVKLTNDQLAAVCLDRGFEIRKGDGTALTREDLLQAATRCVQLEEELNSVIDDLPAELSVELESEIERMKQEKERLEVEQARMLREKAALEQRLRAAGLEVPETTTTTTRNVIRSTRGGGGGAATDTPEALEDVLRTSFTMLFDRVGRDMNFIGKVLHYVAVKPGSAVLSVAWRYAGPTVEGLTQQVVVIVDHVLAIESVIAIRRQVVDPLVTTLLPLVRPMVTQTRSVVTRAITKLETIEPVHKCAVVAGAVLGPLKDSLLIGWDNTFLPNLIIARRKSATWWQRIRNETRTKQQQQPTPQQELQLSPPLPSTS